MSCGRTELGHVWFSGSLWMYLSNLQETHLQMQVKYCLAFQHVVIQKVDQAVGASFLIVADTIFVSCYDVRRSSGRWRVNSFLSIAVEAALEKSFIQHWVWKRDWNKRNKKVIAVAFCAAFCCSLLSGTFLISNVTHQEKNPESQTLNQSESVVF